MTVIELCVGAGIGFLALSIAWGLFHMLFAGKRWDVAGMTHGSYMQKDARPGLRRLMRCVNEAVEVLEPAAGASGPELMLRALTGARLRIRVDPDTRSLISEREQGGAWVADDESTVRMRGCAGANFAVIAPHVVTAVVTLEQAGLQQPYSMTLETRNGYARF